MFETARSFCSLLRWLGPWTKADVVPPGIERTHWLLREGELYGDRAYRRGTKPDRTRPTLVDAYVYTPPHSHGLYVIAPGLEGEGVDDPRFDRFCRIIARAGFTVVAPFIASYVDLRVERSAIDDFETVVEASAARFASLGRPTLFSISFGSFLAFEVAARRPELVGRIVTFGGYADFDAVARFCVDGTLVHADGVVERRAYDPLNLAALFLNVCPFVEVAGDRDAFEDALRALCFTTWGKMELKAPGALEPHIERMAGTLEPAQQTLFRIAAGDLDGAVASYVSGALAHGASHFAFLNPSEALARITCPVVVAHGREDDVIPYTEAAKLEAALRPHTEVVTYLTGAYSHTGEPTLSLRSLAGEVRALLGIAHALARSGSDAV